MGEDSEDLVVDSQVHGAFKFGSIEEAIDWLDQEQARWTTTYQRASSSSEDPVSDVGHQAAKEHAGDWRAFHDELNSVYMSGRHQENFRNSQNVLHSVAKKLDSRDLILSTSTLGRRILSLCSDDPAAARVAISLSTGRDVTKLTGPSVRHVWRALTRIQVGLGFEDADGVAKRLTAAQQTAESAVIAIAKKEHDAQVAIAGYEKLVRDEISSWRQLMVVEERTAAAEREKALEDTKMELRAMRDNYLHAQALLEPRKYWTRRRYVNTGAAVAWGIVAIVASVLLLNLVFSAETTDALRKASEHARGIYVSTSAGSQQVAAIAGQSSAQTTHESPGWIAILPELVTFAVAGFLFLWFLRFAVRRITEHLARGEEAAQRVTMLETFLALAAGKVDGKPALVTDADRALIVQCLFRWSAQSPDDGAPPSHWLEDVLGRLSKKEES